MADVPPPALAAAPTVGGWRARLADEGTVELSPFTPMELAAVGAGSPLRGLVATPEFLASTDAQTEEGVRRARWSLIERGLAGSPVEEAGRLRFPLGGDLAAVVAVRRSPALVATVSAAAPETVERPGPEAGTSALIAVLHGVASEEGLFAVLEETTTPDGVHHFSLSTLPAQAGRILRARHELEEDGPAAVSVHVYAPDPVQPSHVQLVLQPGVARLSTDGRGWQRSAPESAWPSLFAAALTT